MVDKYLNLEGLAEVAGYVNSKLRIVTIMPITSTLNDIVLYNGVTTAIYRQGGIYHYEIVKTYYKWSDLSDTYYTLSPTPEVGATVYSDTIGTDSGYTVTLYDAANNQVTINSLVYDRDATGDTDIKDWVSRGHTSVILNGQDKTGSEASFYAPTAAGSEGQVLVSQGTNTEPAWASFSGYSPSFLENSLAFIYGVSPEIDDNTIVFDLGGG